MSFFGKGGTIGSMDTRSSLSFRTEEIFAAVEVFEGADITKEVIPSKLITNLPHKNEQLNL